MKQKRTKETNAGAGEPPPIETRPEVGGLGEPCGWPEGAPPLPDEQPGAQNPPASSEESPSKRTEEAYSCAGAVADASE